MAKINKEEYENLKILDDEWKWIARDNPVSLFAYRERPVKYKDTQTWSNLNGVFEYIEPNLFQFIQWEDKEPYRIAELIEGYESEETEVKKDKKWLIERVENYIPLNDKTVGQVVDNILAIIRQLDEPEVLSQEWINEHKWVAKDTKTGVIDYAVADYDLQNLLVPKQEEITESFKETVRELIETSELAMDVRKLTGMTLEEIKEEARNGGFVPKRELPVIPKFVADFLDGKEDYMLYELLDGDFIYDNHDELARWLYDNDEETNKERELRLVLAHIYDYTVEKEQKYYARIKGWENVTTGSEVFNWVYFKEKDTVGISKAVENKYQAVSFTKYEWSNLGINEHNADFVLVEELEE